MEQFCLLDAAHFLDAYGVYASLEKQIASSTPFIINKTDLASREWVEETKEVVRQFHPDPIFYEAIYADIPFRQFFFATKRVAMAQARAALGSPWQAALDAPGPAGAG